MYATIDRRASWFLAGDVNLSNVACLQKRGAPQENSIARDPGQNWLCWAGHPETCRGELPQTSERPVAYLKQHKLVAQVL